MSEIVNYNPDVLSCLANLSNDEVFTPPKLANKILDLLPQDLFKNKDTTFLDPVCKSGVFLREIAKRLNDGLKEKIPDQQKRINHIFKNQLFGITITELTALLSRRSVYCSKKANGKYAVMNNFDDEQGNIFFDKFEHNWENNKCIFCGVNKTYDRGEELESYAYPFIHIKNIKEFFDVKFDVIIGNPPYQLNVGNNSGNKSKAKAIYHQFIDQAIKLNPRFIAMITPSRWMTKSTEGIPEKWVDDVLSSNKIKIMHDYKDAKDLFTGVGIEGGVNFFLWEKEHNGKCEYWIHESVNHVSDKPIYDYLDNRKIGIVIRDKFAQGIIDKIEKIEKNYYLDNNANFSSLVSPKDFFTSKTKLTSSWNNYSEKESSLNNIKYFLNKRIYKKGFAWIKKEDIPKNFSAVKLHKVFIAAAHGGHSKVLGNPIYGEPNSACSQTYLVIGYDPDKHKLSKEECMNISSYISTKFFRYLVSIKKKTQNGPRGVYQFVPLQEFSKKWTDKEIYKKYNFSLEEINYIESTIIPMKDHDE